jgi:26S proteasome regulatory subunit N8
VFADNKSFCFLPVPFDEDEKDKSVWFLDHDYLENMYAMFKKVNGE